VTPITSLERRLAGAAISASVAVFLGLLAWLPAFYQSFDEAKYLGIGYNLLAGNGPRTLFGALFLTHPPLWPATVAAPDVWFGIDALSWGHFLNAVLGAAFIVLVAAFGWQIRPVVGGLAAAGCLAVPYLHDLARTARLDVPTATLALLYLWLGLLAVRRASVGWALAAGIVLAIGFLVKETMLPFAPVPLLVGLLEGRPWSRLLRASGVILLVASAGVSWWFVMYAGYVHRVYRLGTPAWTLLPLAMVVAGLGVGALVASWLAGRSGGSAVAARPASGVPGIPDLRGRPALAWGGTILWAVALTLFFGRQQELRGAGLFQPRQYALWLQAWLPALWPIVAMGVAGTVLAVLAWKGADVRYRAGLGALFLATVCGAPLVLLVIALGEPPRNLLAQIGLLIAIGAAGWFWLADSLVQRLREPAAPRPDATLALAPEAAGVSTGNPAEIRPMPAGLLVAGVLGTFLVGTLILGVHGLTHQTSGSGDSRSVDVSTVTGWIKGHVPAGSKIGFGSLLGYEMALELAPRYPMVQIHQTLTMADPSAPEGLGARGGPRIDDWLAVDVAPRAALQFAVFRASDFARAVTGRGISTYVYTIGTSTSVPSLVPALTPEHGFTLVDHVVGHPASGPPIESFVFAVDPARVSFAGSALYITADALERLLGQLEADPAAARAAAANLMKRVAITDAGTRAASLMERLDRLARS
jgi:4-amino-4-deoxy-L-arabinose transferase-like glycosyltransferase